MKNKEKITTLRIKNFFKSIVEIYTYEKYGWCKNVLAKTKSGTSCDLNDPKVHSVCFLGAANIVLHRKHLSEREKNILFSSVCDVMTIQTKFHTPQFFNDYECKSKQDMIKTLDKIIKSL